MGPRRTTQSGQVSKRDESGESGERNERGGKNKRKPSEDGSLARQMDTNKRKRLASRSERAVAIDREEGEVVGDAVPAPRDVQLDAELSAEEVQMMTMMGIPFGFGTTQGRKVEDEACNVGAVKVNSKRTARQYMNRTGGHNKDLPAETNR